MLLETIHFKNYEISDPQTTDALKIRHTFYRQCPPVVTYLDKWLRPILFIKESYHQYIADQNGDERISFCLDAACDITLKKTTESLNTQQI